VGSPPPGRVQSAALPASLTSQCDRLAKLGCIPENEALGSKVSVQRSAGGEGVRGEYCRAEGKREEVRYAGAR
jgi:hypothetical protein